VFLNDGVYGTLTEFPLIGNIDRIQVLDPQGRPRGGEGIGRVIFGPTCDSVDRLPGEIVLPGDTVEGDYLVIQGIGAYSMATNTRFNGFGAVGHATVMALE
jgi:ornithine decarboxylase